MQKNLKEVSDYWNKMYSRQIKEYRPFEISEDFKRFATLFAPGNSYCYVVNLYNFELEYVSDSVELFLGRSASEIDLKDLMQTITPDELELITHKSKLISNFYTCFLDKSSVLNYKNLFSYRMKDATGQIRTMLYQAVPLSVLENGAPEHVFCIQTDVSHLKITTTNTVSFVHLNGGKNYLNIDIAGGVFDPENCESAGCDLLKQLTRREIEIVRALSGGLNAEEIAARLHLSPHTVRTHRRNILRKTDCTNTTELVAKCITGGIISPV